MFHSSGGRLTLRNASMNSTDEGLIHLVWFLILGQRSDNCILSKLTPHAHSISIEITPNETGTMFWNIQAPFLIIKSNQLKLNLFSISTIRLLPGPGFKTERMAITNTAPASYIQILSSLDKWQILLGRICVTNIISVFHSHWRDECCDIPVKLRDDVFIEDADFHCGISVNLKYLRLMEIFPVRCPTQWKN